MAIPSLSASLPAAPAAKPAGTSPAPRVARGGETSSSAIVEIAGKIDPAVVQAYTQPSREQVDQAVEQMREALPPVARNLQFSVDEATGRSVVKVVDSSTNEVIRQMPSEELLNIARTLDKLTGLLLKQKA